MSVETLLSEEITLLDHEFMDILKSATTQEKELLLGLILQELAITGPRT